MKLTMFKMHILVQFFLRIHQYSQIFCYCFVQFKMVTSDISGYLYLHICILGGNQLAKCLYLLSSLQSMFILEWLHGFSCISYILFNTYRFHLTLEIPTELYCTFKEFCCFVFFYFF